VLGGCKGWKRPCDPRKKKGRYLIPLWYRIGDGLKM
jgi:hypothetical protein